jgi:hypothetical protein
MAYPQNPVTVSKGGHIVKDVFLADLAAWQAEGYEIYDPTAPIATEEPEAIATKKKATKSTPLDSE